MVARPEERSALIGLGLLLAGAGLGIAAALLFILNREEDEPRRAATVRVLSARGSLTPRVHLFGDRVVARIDVTADRRALDPATVRAHITFSPYRRVGEAAVTRSDDGQMSRISFVTTLVCLESVCVPRDGRKRFEFPLASVEYRLRGTTRRSGTLVQWPVVEAVTRLGPLDLQANRWRGNVFSLPEVSYRISPGGLAGALYGGAFVLTLLAGALVFLALRGRVERPKPVAAAPGLELTALERALRLVESSNGRVDDQRRALELLARELAAHGDEDLANAARELAWSEDVPAEAATESLLLDVRRSLENGNGELS